MNDWSGFGDAIQWFSPVSIRPENAPKNWRVMRTNIAYLVVILVLAPAGLLERVVGATTAEVPEDILEAIGLGDLVVLPYEDHPEDMPLPEPAISTNQNAATAAGNVVPAPNETAVLEAAHLVTRRQGTDNADLQKIKVPAVQKKVAPVALVLEEAEQGVVTAGLEPGKSRPVVETPHDDVWQVDRKSDEVAVVTFQIGVHELTEALDPQPEVSGVAGSTDSSVSKIKTVNWTSQESVTAKSYAPAIYQTSYATSRAAASNSDNPDATFHLGDVGTVRIGREFSRPHETKEVVYRVQVEDLEVASTLSKLDQVLGKKKENTVKTGRVAEQTLTTLGLRDLLIISDADGMKIRSSPTVYLLAMHASSANTVVADAQFGQTMEALSTAHLFGTAPVTSIDIEKWVGDVGSINNDGAIQRIPFSVELFDGQDSGAVYQENGTYWVRAAGNSKG